MRDSPMFKKPLPHGDRLISRTGSGWRFQRRPMARTAAEKGPDRSEGGAFPEPRAPDPLRGERFTEGKREAVATEKGMPDMTLKHMIEAYERQLIESALQATSGNQRRAAAQLGVLPTTL